MPSRPARIMPPRDHSPAPPDEQPEHADTALEAANVETRQNELAAGKARYDRLASDFDSFRRRTVRDTEMQAAAQKDAFIREFLTIIDNLDRALVGDAHPASDSLRRGIEMTLEQSLALLRRHGIEPVESAGTRFDPRWHEAISARRDPRQPDHVVLDVVQRGYRRGDEVIRVARVIINDHARR